jgi:hypothetical protein
MKDALLVIFLILDFIFDVLLATAKFIKPYAHRLYVSYLRPLLLRLVRWAIAEGIITLARPTGWIPFVG